MFIKFVENNSENQNSIIVEIKFRNYYLQQYLLPVVLEFELSFWEVSYDRYSLNHQELEQILNSEREILFISI